MQWFFAALVVLGGLGISIAYLVAPRALFLRWHGWQLKGDPEPSEAAVGAMQLRGGVGIVASLVLGALVLSVAVSGAQQERKHEAREALAVTLRAKCDTVLPKLDAGVVYDDDGALTNGDDLEAIIDDPDVTVELNDVQVGRDHYRMYLIAYTSADDPDMQTIGVQSITFTRVLDRRSFRSHTGCDYRLPLR